MLDVNLKTILKHQVCHVILESDGSATAGQPQSFGGPKPMLPYSSMFVFGPTNP